MLLNPVLGDISQHIKKAGDKTVKACLLLFIRLVNYTPLSFHGALYSRLTYWLISS